MKKYIYLLCAGLVGLMMSSCEGPEGPPGTDGTDGIAGEDGNATCLVCHNLDTKMAIEDQYEESLHGEGGAVARSTNNDCSRCHSNEGFHETLRTGKDTTAEGIALPTRIDCETCHSFHESLDFENDGQDYALSKTTPVKFMKYPSTVIDFGNSTNLCAYCHQTRTAAPGDDATDENWDQGAGTYYISSSNKRFGPHHGTQGNLLAGIGGYKPGVDGSSHPHKTAGCNACHMHREGEDGKADHTFHPSVNACAACHSGATNFDINGVQTEIDALAAQLRTLLVGADMLDADDYATVDVTYPLDEAGALWNYRSIVVEDRSHGVHNPVYIKAMLEQGIAEMSKK